MILDQIKNDVINEVRAFYLRFPELKESKELNHYLSLIERAALLAETEEDVVDLYKLLEIYRVTTLPLPGLDL